MAMNEELKMARNEELIKGIRKEVFDMLENHLLKAFDDFRESWTISITDYNKIKKELV